MDRRFNTGDAKDVMRSFLGSPHNYQPTRKLIEGEIASFIKSSTASDKQIVTPPKWAVQIVPLPSSTSTARYDVPLVTSRLYHATFASMLGAAVQRTYYATEYTLSLLVHFQMSVANVANTIANSVLLPSPNTTSTSSSSWAVVDPSGMEQLLSSIKDTILVGEGAIGAKQLSIATNVLDQYSPTRYGQDDAVCGAVRAALLEGISGRTSSSSSAGGEGWTHEVIVAVLVADYVLAAEERWLWILSQSDDPSTAATAIPNLPKLRDFSTSLLQQVFVPLSNNYVSAQVIEGLSQTYSPSSAGSSGSSSSERGTQPLLSSLTMATLFAKFYHPLRAAPTTSTISTATEAEAAAVVVVDRVAQANASNTQKNQSDDIVVAHRKNYGIPLPCLITRDEFAVVAGSLYQLKIQSTTDSNTATSAPTTTAMTKEAISSILRRAHLSDQASHVLSSPSPWVSAHEQHLVDLIHSLYF
eukprot:GFYU01037719.1.p1 GENE.GFYU01037719.1~~GFYU01037719.1.p1  ORF type:complete len:496 (+),score=-10.07 GFYU01037719.1:76-1488(+)